MFRKGCLAVCFLLWRLFDCSSTTAAAATSSSTSSRQQQGAAGRQPQAAAGSSRQQQTPAGSRQQQTPAEAAAGSSRQRQAAAKLQFYSRVSEVTLDPFSGFLCYVLGTKLGGVLPFRLCLEKGVWLLVSCFRRWAARAAAVAAAAAAAISSHQQQQQQSKLDSIGLDFEQDKRGYKRGYERISSRISEGTFRPPGTCYCDWFCVIFGTKLGGVLPFRLCLEKAKLDSIGLDFEQDKRGYKRGYERISSRISEGTFRPPGTCYCDWFCVIFGTKLGGVLPFRLCLEKDVCLLVYCISSHQQQQPQQSKLDWTGLDF